jgi:aryl-alcohol dehydrogenase-like predicted oxidoreductase
MQYQTIPHTELVVSEICLGSGDMGGSIEPAASWNLLDIFLERGGNFIDTAHVYNDWLPGEKSRSEKIIGAWMKDRKNRSIMVLATKGGHHPVDGAPYVNRITPIEVRIDLEESLVFLQTDSIDLYWLHRDNPDIPAGDLLEILEVARSQGKIRYYGASNWRPERLAEAQAYAAEHGLAGFVADQMLWNAAKTDAQAIQDKTIMVMNQSLFDFHSRTGMPAIPYTSQANGLFSKMARGVLAQLYPGMLDSFPLEENSARYKMIQQVMLERGLSLSQVVLGWLLSQPFPTIPIVGPKNRAQLEDSLSAAGVRLNVQAMNFIV